MHQCPLLQATLPDWLIRAGKTLGIATAAKRVDNILFNDVVDAYVCVCAETV